MDLQKIPPIQQKRIVTFVNYFIIDTVSFLNKFINSSENTLWKLEKRMRKLETTLKLMEAKLNFIPESDETVCVSNVPTSLEETGVDNSAAESREKENIEEPITNQVESEIDEPASEIPEEIRKYVRMVKVGVPTEAVKLKMKNEGFDPDLLKLD